tara:strand:+ start:1591 stop:2142 length:552 start_codon:yes stop_codon:yes gene_type:complete
MEITRQLVMTFTLVFGPLVLASYVYGLSHAERPMDLWGGVPEAWRAYIVPFMFVAAIGFLMYWYVVFFQFEDSTIESLRWPWGDGDGQGAGRLLLAFAIFLVPSALWIESTILHIENDFAWTQYLVIGTLFLTSVGNVLLGLLAFAAYQDGVDGSSIMLVGAFMLAIQCILNDFVIWVYKFPW